MSTPASPYTSVSRRELDVQDYADIARRHLGWLLGPVFGGLVIACVIAFLLPNVYVSQAALRIAPSQISEQLIPSVVNQLMVDRINQMQQDILSRTSLSELIQRPDLNLYRSELDRKPLEDVIEKMRTKDIKIGIMSMAGQGNRPASAFSISFAYPDRVKAQRVVQALVTKFTESNVSSQRTQTVVTTEFISDELQQAKAEVEKASNTLTDFRVHNSGRLPEQSQYNIQALTALQNERSSLDGALNRDSQEKLLLESRLDTLKSQYATIVATAPAPAEEPQVSVRNERLTDLNKRIAETQSRLNSLREVYKETYPDIRNFEQQIAVWSKERDALQKENEKADAQAKSTPKKNPQLTRSLSDVTAQTEQTRAAIRAVDLDRAEKLKQTETINAQINTYQSRLEAGPANEQKYAQLVKDYQLASAKYQDLQQKQGVADTHKAMVTRKAGENLEVLDPASLPEQPTSPARSLICGVGLLAGLVIGASLVAVRELKDTSLKNLKDVRAYTQLPILSSIPLLENDLLVQRRRRLTYVGWSAAVILGVLACTASMYYHFNVTHS